MDFFLFIFFTNENVRWVEIQFDTNSDERIEIQVQVES